MSRLVDHEPRWALPSQWSAQSPPFYTGVSWNCPHCKARLAVQFHPPIDPEKLIGRMFEWPKYPAAWTRVSGDTFDTLTLIPSIGFDNPPHWHGTLTNGELTP